MWRWHDRRGCWCIVPFATRNRSGLHGRREPLVEKKHTLVFIRTEQTGKPQQVSLSSPCKSYLRFHQIVVRVHQGCFSDSFHLLDPWCVSPVRFACFLLVLNGIMVYHPQPDGAAKRGLVREPPPRDGPGERYRHAQPGGPVLEQGYSLHNIRHRVRHAVMHVSKNFSSRLVAKEANI